MRIRIRIRITVLKIFKAHKQQRNFSLLHFLILLNNIQYIFATQILYQYTTKLNEQRLSHHTPAINNRRLIDLGRAYL
jgi:hypothetical protein